jgi:hypothetical protein
LYVPYLYGRQGECRALEDVAPFLGTPQKVVPLIEPVIEKARDLSRALVELEANSADVYVVLNPSRYKLQTDQARTAWSTALAAELSAPNIRPTIEVRNGVDLADLVAFAKAHGSKHIGVSIRDDVIAASDILTATSSVTATFFVHPSAVAGNYLTALPSARLVEVRDSFRPEVRNADYVGEEHFTSAHQSYTAVGHAGFADFTILPGTFNAKGGPIGAAVIHFSFVNSVDSTVWVQHFVSDETKQFQSTGPTKLMEAMTKLDAQASATPTRFAWASPGYASYRVQFLTASPTSPTYNKRQQIAHHIFTAATAF